MPPPKAVTFNKLLDQLGHFLLVAIHLILFVRQCYPEASFLKARAYNFPVAQSRHPTVCEWISSAVSAIIGEVRKGKVARAGLVITHPETCKPLERFMWDLSRLPVIPKMDHDTPLARDQSLEPEAKHYDMLPAQEVDLSEQFRGALASLSACQTRLKPIPEECTFTVAIELKDEADVFPPVGHPQPWIPVQPNLQHRKSRDQSQNAAGEEQRTASADNSQIDIVSEQRSSNSVETEAKVEGRDLGGVRSVPLRAVSSGEVDFEMWIEEGDAKKDAFQSMTSSLGGTQQSE